MYQMWSEEKNRHNIFWLIMWLNNSLTYAEEEQNADGEELSTHVLSHTRIIYMSDTTGIIGRALFLLF